MKHWFSDLYANIDATRLDEFAAGLAPDGARALSRRAASGHAATSRPA